MLADIKKTESDRQFRIILQLDMKYILNPCKYGTNNDQPELISGAKSERR